MGRTKKNQRGNRRRSISSSSSSSKGSRSSSFSDRSGGYRRSRSRHDRYYEKRPEMRMYSLYQPGYGGMPMGNGYPMHSGMMPGGMMSQMPGGMMAQYGTPVPNIMPSQQVQPTIYPFQTGMISWPYQATQLSHPPQMQPATPATPVFQFQISPGKNILGRK